MSDIVKVGDLVIINPDNDPQTKWCTRDCTPGKAYEIIDVYPTHEIGDREIGGDLEYSLSHGDLRIAFKDDVGDTVKLGNLNVTVVPQD